MSFAPGQFITAQRLNRLQSKTYWVQASAFMPASASVVDITGATMPITVETDGATAAFFWSADNRSSSIMGNNSSIRAMWDVNGSPNFAVYRSGVTGTPEAAATFNTWATTIPTHGTYTFKLNGATQLNNTFQVYTSLTVIITEVA